MLPWRDNAALGREYINKQGDKHYGDVPKTPQINPSAQRLLFSRRQCNSGLFFWGLGVQLHGLNAMGFCTFLVMLLFIPLAYHTA